MSTSTLSTTIALLLSPGKGILAADESLPTIGKRFAALAIPATTENRRAYRELLFTTPGLGEFISGVILFDETIHQQAGGLPMADLLFRQNLVPGIKVDTGTTPLAAFAGEKITQGIDGLRERLIAYRQLGARFTKWRAVLAVGDGLPTRFALEENARALARFAALSQEAGLVPVVEPEVLMDGSHSLARGEDVMQDTLRAVFCALADHRVVLEEMLLKTAMTLPGSTCPDPVDEAAVTAATWRVLRRTVPAAVPGIVFLSGGQSDLAATARLNALCRADDLPWTLSFSFGRALQHAAMQIWKGVPANSSAAQATLRHRARCDSLALAGRYSEEAESAAPPGR